ncbi:MAG: tRNA (adenosine(37)-N6)-dimethylallyltransferase MiaA [Oscillospiraceae bacterium]|nr:tRNA (adenosine(37)-N6)-dimethylallyltransferase MiaA [Oscillospiraceae bacterium]
MSVIAIVGPTATGKSKLAISLAEKLETEIISADAFQIYKEFSICTAKPSSESLSKINHYFINHISVTQEYNVAKFVSEAKKIIFKIFSNGKIPIIVGGTGLYIDALLEDYKFKNEDIPKDSFLNSSEHFTFAKSFLEWPHTLTSLSEKSGSLKKSIISVNSEKSEEKFILLQKNESENIDFLNSDDKRFVNYVLKKFKKSGIPIMQQNKIILCSNNFYNIIKIGLNYRKRSNLHTKINKRVDQMVSNGLIEEARYIKQNFKVSKTASVTIGYKELLPFLENKITAEQAIEIIKIRTRQYAKRQITWFKRKIRDNWFYID